MTTIKVPENLADNPEIKLYLSIIEKLESELSAKELSKPKPSKAICLSNLRSPSNKNVELSEDNVKSMLDRVSNLIIRYGREIL
jgi:hypothetical protein